MGKSGNNSDASRVQRAQISVAVPKSGGKAANTALLLRIIEEQEVTEVQVCVH